MGVKLQAKMGTEAPYIIFDGSCGFCNASALWVAKRDLGNVFIFVSNSSAFGLELLKSRGLDQESSRSIILIDSNGKVLVKSRAIRKILESIPGYSGLKMVMKYTPLFLQNSVYDIIAYFRRRIPLSNSCEMPDEAIRKRFKR
jgi:predicted DCC family thiol-disulfide oxidoreductase YuxK